MGATTGARVAESPKSVTGFPLVFHAGLFYLDVNVKTGRRNDSE